MAKYRITLENLEGGDYTGENTIECEGFLLLCNNETDDSFKQIIQSITRMDIASYSAQSDTLYPASMLARGLVEMDREEKNMKMHSAIDKMQELLGGLKE